MISDSITNASATAAPTSARDFGKKKRTNRSAKLKQSKLGLRREQWLSQVAMINRGDKEEMDSNRRIGSEKPDQRDRPVENLDGQRREEDDNSGTHRHESFIESLSNSPNSILSGMNSIPNFSSSSSSGSGGSCSGNITEEEDADADADDDGCLDDWEAIADALAADDEKHEKENPPESCEEHESIESASPRDIMNGSDVAVRDAKPDCSRTMSRKQKSNQAWRADDKLRPQGLPNLEKQRSFPVMNLHYSSLAVPSSCPICYEDLDLTDSNFLPCPCGFRLCLFCHKTICDGDGRCPGCRKPYERNTIKVEASVQGGGLTIRLARSTSMFCRS